MDPTAVSRPKAQDLIPGYRLERLVGKGGMGEVHKAVQLSLGRTVAVKLLANELASDPNFVGRFEKEGAALAALSHPNIVSIVDKGKAGNTYYLVMEYVGGQSMRELMRSPSLGTGDALKLARDLCKAIEYAHSRGVVHRDLKPENILFDEQAGGIPKVTDFGLAGFLDSGALAARFALTETNVSMGTFSYMAPEQRIDAKTADHRADIYSLGVIIYELLVGEVPAGSFDLPSTRRPGLSRQVDTIVSRCLKASPADRYQRVADLLDDLEPLVPATSMISARRLSPMARAKRAAADAARRTLRVAAVVVVLLAVGVVGATMVRARNRTARPSPGLELVTDTGQRWPLTSPGRLDSPEEERRRLSLGDGPDTVSVVAHGRKPLVQNGAIYFPPPGDDAAVGRALLDADLEGTGLSFRAHAQVTAPPSGTFAAAQALFLGPPADSRSALVLSGEPGRYVALVVSASGAPPLLEWALGSERRGTMSSPSGPDSGDRLLELSIDAKTGELSAWVGDGGDRRLVGNSMSLGPGWQKLFGEMPKGAVGCLDGACRFTSVEWVAVHPPRPPPPPDATLALPDPAPPKAVAAVKTPPGTTPRPGVTPAPAPAPKKPLTPPAKPPPAKQPPPPPPPPPAKKPPPKKH